MSWQAACIGGVEAGDDDGEEPLLDALSSSLASAGGAVRANCSIIQDAGAVQSSP
jgi:hypothetical protein